MAATVYVSETNTGSTTVHDNITNSNMGSTDTYDLVAADYPITAGNYSYEKWQRIKLSALGGSTKIKTLKIWRTTALSGSDSHKTNARESGYAGAATYATPVMTASSIATQTMPTSTPTGANLGIGGSLTGELSSAGTYSDYCCHQLLVDSGTTAGASCTMNYQYDEVA
jgi:hypothetical protein